MSKDLYSVLGVEKDADDKTIKKAFRKLALDCHPDRHADDPDAESRFKAINDAYQTLGDPEKRKAYDQPPPRGFPGFGSGASGFDPFGFERSNSPSGPVKGVNVQIRVSIPFMTAISGGVIDVTVPAWAACDCSDGKIYESNLCPGCNGSGTRSGQFANMSIRLTCDACGGVGRRWQSCGGCSGRGQTATPTEKSLNIPAGIDDGQIINIGGMGMKGRRGGPPGDLHVCLQVLPHEIFDRRGADIHIEMPVTYPEAVLGGKVEVPMLDGTRARVNVPAGSRAGQVMRLPGKGVQAAGRAPGHLYCHVVIDVITDPSPDAVAALELLASAIKAESQDQSPELPQA